MDIRPGKVRLGIDAPANVSVLRSELVPVEHSKSSEIEYDLGDPVA